MKLPWRAISPVPIRWVGLWGILGDSQGPAKTGPLASRFLVLPPACVATSIANFISLEVSNIIEALGRLGFLPALRPWPVIAMFGVKPVVNVPTKVV